MKKNFITILAVLVVVDLAALGIWWKHKSSKPAEPAPVAITPAPAPEPTNMEQPRPADETGTSQRRIDSSYGMSLFGPGISPGGCETMEACETYCLKPENEKECLAWTQGDADKKRAKREAVDGPGLAQPLPPPPVYEAEFNTPGGCQGNACAAFCRDTNNLDECLDYCTDPRYKKKCLKWGVSGPLREAMSGALVGSAAVIDQEAFEILQKRERP